MSGEVAWVNRAGRENVATRPERVILTYDDYCQLPEDRNRYELFEGELQVTPSPSTRHQRIVRKLAYILIGHVEQQQSGEVFFAPFDVLLSDITVVQPDILFVSRERQAIVLPAHIRGAPDLAIEVVSPTTSQRDHQAKRQLYARHGVSYYWLVDPDRQRIEAYALDDGDYRRTVVASETAGFAAPPFPDLAIPLADLWEA